MSVAGAAPPPMKAALAVALVDQALEAVGRLLADADGNRRPYDIETPQGRSVVSALIGAETLLVDARDALRAAAIRVTVGQDPAP